MAFSFPGRQRSPKERWFMATSVRSSAFGQIKEGLISLSTLNPKYLQYTIILYHCTLWIPSIPKLLFGISSNFLCKKLTSSSTGCLVIKYDFKFWLNNNKPVDDNHTNTHTYMLLYKAPPPKNQLQTVVSIFLIF